MIEEMVRAAQLVNQERERQDAKWGQQNHEAPVWSLIATEELGEVAQAHLEILFSGSQSVERASYIDKRNAYIMELVQLTAVCFAWLECEIRRNKELYK